MRRFERALEAILDHYDSLRHLRPDAGSRAPGLIDRVEAAASLSIQKEKISTSCRLNGSCRTSATAQTGKTRQLPITTVS